VLAKYHAGNAVPTINLSSPTAGTYNSIVPVTGQRVTPMAIR
jgi:hypothetical protein